MLSLTAARANFLACGASDPRFVGRVRAPLASERIAGQNAAFRPAV
jgi:hypothetical protein